jgi:hypothetical protein
MNLSIDKIWHFRVLRLVMKKNLFSRIAGIPGKDTLFPNFLGNVMARNMEGLGKSTKELRMQIWLAFFESRTLRKVLVAPF